MLNEIKESYIRVLAQEGLSTQGSTLRLERRLSDHLLETGRLSISQQALVEHARTLSVRELPALGILSGLSQLRLLACEVGLNLPKDIKISRETLRKAVAQRILCEGLDPWEDFGYDDIVSWRRDASMTVAELLQA